VPIAPGVDPPYRAAAACPNSWNPAETTVKANTVSSRAGWSNAWWVAEASPLWRSTQPHTAKNAATSTTTTTGAKSSANGAVTRLVASGSETTYLNLSANKGFERRTSGSDPSAFVSTPRVRSLLSHRVSMSAADTWRPTAAPTASATSAMVRRPSTCSSTA
jgi:hypothetical protein